MSKRILRTYTEPLLHEIYETTHNGEGYSVIMRDQFEIASEKPDQWMRAGKFAIAVNKEMTGKGWTSVGHLGGGFNYLARILRLTKFNQTIYEIEPALEDKCPPGVTFVAGDWFLTLPSGVHDLLIWDIDEDPPVASLHERLKPGGCVMYQKNNKVEVIY
jgi:hypothetical protein